VKGISPQYFRSWGGHCL